MPSLKDNAIGFPSSRLRLQHPNVELSDDVVQFCVQNDLVYYFSQALALAKKTFSSITKLGARLQEDPEEADQEMTRVVIDVTVNTDVPTTLSEKRVFTMRWVEAAPAKMREKIRVLYHFV